VSHLKTSSGIAVAALALSFLIGLIGGAGFPMLLIRAFVFAALFFGLAELIHALTSRFLPELFQEKNDEEETPSTGTHIDISVEDGDMEKLATAPDEQPAQGLDQMTESGYTEKNAETGTEAFTPTPPVTEVLSSRNGDLPDIDNMADAFTVDDDDDALFSPPPRRKAASGTNPLGKNFDAAKMAGAIQTVLRRE
jgi:hypothetical protein